MNERQIKRKLRKLSETMRQDEVAALCGIHIKTLYNWLHNKHAISPDKILLVSVTLEDRKQKL